jgi:hypothetical protein
MWKKMLTTESLLAVPIIRVQTFHTLLGRVASETTL